jgi:hypothetical protein
MIEKSPVFIMGPARSGTSLLYRLLQLHSEFRPGNCESGVELTETKAFQFPSLLYKRKTSYGGGAYSYMLFNRSLYHEFKLKTASLCRWQTMLEKYVISGDYNSVANRFKFTRENTYNELIRRWLWRLYRGPRLMQYFFEIAKKARGVKRLVEKTPMHLKRIPEIRTTFPNAKMIALCRHPIDIYSSYRRRFKAELAAGVVAENSWLDISAGDFCGHYEEEVEIIKAELSKGSDGFLHVRYEDMTQDPESTLLRIFSFLGLGFEQGCIVDDERSQMNWKIDPHLFGTIKTKTKEWKEFVAESEAEYIEDRLGPAIQYLGYERYTMEKRDRI